VDPCTASTALRTDDGRLCSARGALSLSAGRDHGCGGCWRHWAPKKSLVCPNISEAIQVHRCTARFVASSNVYCGLTRLDAELRIPQVAMVTRGVDQNMGGARARYEPTPLTHGMDDVETGRRFIAGVCGFALRPLPAYRHRHQQPPRTRCETSAPTRVVRISSVVSAISPVAHGLSP